MRPDASAPGMILPVPPGLVLCGDVCARWMWSATALTGDPGALEQVSTASTSVKVQAPLSRRWVSTL
ncbi:hypothetical protein [Actinosynnema sp.]|uniref:hypothetical protein n=1 Tax=Actinosynnema sp. TaxID=1872144 RepID=UPI003F84A244